MVYYTESVSVFVVYFVCFITCFMLSRIDPSSAYKLHDVLLFFSQQNNRLFGNEHVHCIGCSYLCIVHLSWRMISRNFHVLAHLSRRFMGELIVYPCSSVCLSSSSVRSHFQRASPLKLPGQSKPNFMWRLLG